MSTLYEMAGTTKQAHWLSVRRGERQEDRFALLSASLSEERENHPAMSLKKIHHRAKRPSLRFSILIFLSMKIFHIAFARGVRIRRCCPIRIKPNKAYQT